MSDSALHLTFLNGEDVDRLDVSDGDILAAVEMCLRAQGLGEAVIEPRVHLEPDPSVDGHFNILRGSITPLGLSGVKIVGDFVDNHLRGLPSEVAVLNLFDSTTGVPTAIVDATAITAMRTGAMTAIGVRYLARRDARVLAHIGARGTAYWNLRLLGRAVRLRGDPLALAPPRKPGGTCPSRPGRAGPFSYGHSGLGNLRRGADVVIEASRLRRPEPLLLTEWIKQGALVIPYGTMSAVELSLTDIMDKIVVDDWGQAAAGSSARCGLTWTPASSRKRRSMGSSVRSSSVRSPGASSADETILFWHRGLSLSDIALGNMFVERAAEQGLGQRLRFA